VAKKHTWYDKTSLKPERERMPRQTTRLKTLQTEEPSYGADGVDVTLIRWMLSMTPEERLQVLQQSIGSILRMQGDKAST
jgi:hypothetical protein